MRILDRYIAGAVLGGVLLVMAVVLVLAALFTFIGQQDDIGVGRFGVASALLYTLLNLPQQMYELLPIGAMIGALLGLGALARGSELTAMRAAGVSIARIAGTTVATGIVLAAIGILLGEFLAPPLQNLAREEKAFGQFENISFAGRGGAWLRDGNLILNVTQQSGSAEYGGMLVFELSPDDELIALGRASRARAAPDDSWQLEDYAESRFAGDYVSGRATATRTLGSSIGGSFLGLAIADPGDLHLGSLWRLRSVYGANGLDVRAHDFAFWSRIARIVAVPFAVLLAVPFVFGSLRGAGAGTRTLIGMLLGISFFLLQRMVESGAIVFDLPPFWLAWLPTAVLASLALALIARLR